LETTTKNKKPRANENLEKNSEKIFATKKIKGIFKNFFLKFSHMKK